MKMNAKTKAWLIENMGCKADATEDEFKAAAAQALVEGKLDAVKLAELQKEPAADAANGFMDQFSKFMNETQTVNAALMQQLKAMQEGAQATKADDSDDGAGAKTADSAAKAPSNMGQAAADAAPVKMGDVKVRGAHESYDATPGKKLYFPEYTDIGMKHPMAGLRLAEGGSRGRREIDEPSMLDKAVMGAYVKLCLNQGGAKGLPASLRMTDHDNDLINYALRNYAWAGVIGGAGSEEEGAQGVKGIKLSDRQIKAVLDDATSGGLEVAPIVFDNAVISTPLLNGEFFPNVNVINITRGRRIEGASIGNVTFSSGGADGTPIPLFSTSGYIAAFDTTIFVADGSIEIGLDFLSDSVPDIANMVIEQYGQQMLTWLDDQICNGDGSTEPEGILVASGTQSVSSANGNGGPPTVGDYEGLLFGVKKQYKAGYPTNRIMFGANETTYRRARSIAVGGSDQRRVFGMTHEDYMLLGHPYGIQGNISNVKAFFGVMPRYRMYRRLGLTLRSTTEGKTLVRANEMLISARFRVGGQIEDGAAFSVVTDMQS